MCVFKEKLKMNNKQNNVVVLPDGTDYILQSLARKLLVVDNGPKNAPVNEDWLPRYKKAANVKSFMLSRGNGGEAAQDISAEQEELLIPTFPIAAHPIWKHNTPDVNKYIQNGIKSIENLETLQCIKLLLATTKPKAHHADGVKLEYITDLMALLDNKKVNPEVILCAPAVFRRLSLIDHKHLFIHRKEEIDKQLKDNISPDLIARGSFFGVPIYMTTFLTNQLFVIGPPESLGVFVVKSKLNIKDSNQPNHLKEGKIISEEIGLATLNDAVYVCEFTLGEIPDSNEAFEIPEFWPVGYTFDHE